MHSTQFSIVCRLPPLASSFPFPSPSSSSPSPSFSSSLSTSSSSPYPFIIHHLLLEYLLYLLYPLPSSILFSLFYIFHLLIHVLLLHLLLHLLHLPLLLHLHLFHLPLHLHLLSSSPSPSPSYSIFFSISLFFYIFIFFSIFFHLPLLLHHHLLFNFVTNLFPTAENQDGSSVSLHYFVDTITRPVGLCLSMFG